jgi:hypothetical protein
MWAARVFQAADSTSQAARLRRLGALFGKSFVFFLIVASRPGKEHG